MSQQSRKRVSVSPASDSVSASKRRAVSSEEIDLQCLICQDVATQTMCCACITTGPDIATPLNYQGPLTWQPAQRRASQYYCKIYVYIGTAF